MLSAYVKAPFVAQQLGAKIMTIGCIDTVDLVVRCNDTLGTIVPDSVLKSTEVDFPEHPLGKIAGHKIPVVFLIVAGVMLHCHVETVLLLDALGNGGCHHAGEPGILREILKVSAAERISMNVDGRCQPIGAAILLHFPIDGIADLIHQLLVLGLGQSVGHRECGGILIENRILFGSPTMNFFTNPGRASKTDMAIPSGLVLPFSSMVVRF